MAGRIEALKAALFKTENFVAGGHGARRPAHGHFTVPRGITIHFYVADTESLSNSIGQNVDRILAGGTAPTPTETANAGDRIHDYHLYSARNGGYLSLASSSRASDHYLTTDSTTDGVALSAICEMIIKRTPNAVLHWSACRCVEGDGDVFPDTPSPTYKAGSALARLASKS
jgi:hypothetical protein